MLKFIFLIIILYFIFVSIRNLARAVMADTTHAARIRQERERYYGPRPQPSQRHYQEAAAAPRPKTTIHVRQQPVRREDQDENVEDAKFRDL